eukprot:CAMPEP_0197182226 /NCGR_PEP_ID=MMETSP1423-20130617/6258_1 /TAXON_ID=476441 /ORGANISM="Pseudo-nitzschia heimii, Strain UNC1101" /LENGTH=66 /DNA_ID=CAMNT_0042632613 /DNA_START=187 /DNA_END=383 /DNA_ORIENTATION=+
MSLLMAALAASAFRYNVGFPTTRAAVPDLPAQLVEAGDAPDDRSLLGGRQLADLAEGNADRPLVHH